jgi:predicted DNA-binding transcriptional regulator AlpA
MKPMNHAFTAKLALPPTLAGPAADPLLSDKESAFILGCGRSTLWRWAADGIIPKPLKIGGMSRWRQSDIEAVITKAEAQRAQ